MEGAGLCSPGRWPITQRRLPASPVVAAIRGLQVDYLKRWEEKSINTGGPDLRTLAYAAAAGKVMEAPFKEVEVSRLREDIRRLLKEAGFEVERRASDLVQRIEVRLAQGYCAATLDPEYTLFG